MSPPLHVRLVPVPQQGWLMAPQAVHIAGAPPPTAVQLKLAPQVPFPWPGQQASFAPPHASHLFEAGAPPAPPAPPLATHALPAWQMSPGQQAPPTVPHIMQVRGAPPPGLAQPSPVPHVFPPQHTWETPPQGVHVPAPKSWVLQRRLAPHSVCPPMVVVQQGCPTPPHATHICAAQSPCG
jgi:hypothetical protein